MFFGAILYAIFCKNYLFNGIFANFWGIIRKDFDLCTVFSVRLGFFSSSNKYICRRLRIVRFMASGLRYGHFLIFGQNGPCLASKMTKWPYLRTEAKKTKFEQFIK